MTVNLNDYYLKQKEPNRSCLLALRTILLSEVEGLEETRKYGMPCFCINNKALFYLWTDKKTHEPYILFVDGNLIEHPTLETGDRKRMKIFRVNPSEDLRFETIKELIKLALKLKKLP